jgi:rhomboid protease GluP
MRDEFITETINGLCRYYNYGVIQISNYYNLASTWALVKGGENNQKEVIIFINEGINSESAGLLSSLTQELNCDTIRMTKVILAEDKLIYQNRNVDEYGADSIGIDYKNKEIVFYGIECEKAAYEVANIIHNIKLQENKNTKHEDKAIVTYLIIIAIIIMFFVSVLISQNFLQGFFSIDSNVLKLLGATNKKLILQGEYYRLITSMFLHGGIIHIALNMYALML